MSEDELVIEPGGNDLGARGRRIVEAAALAHREVREVDYASLCDPAVAYLFDRADPGLEQLLVALRSERGGAGKVDQVRSSLSRMGREARARLRVLPDDEVGPGLREAVGGPDDWPDYPVPAGWQVSPRGIVKVERQGDAEVPVLVAEEPIAVIGIRVDVGTGREAIVLGYRRHRSWRRLVVPREVARDARALVALAGEGVPVSSDSARYLARWVVACEAAAGDELPRSRCTTRTGWHGDLYVSGPGGEIELEDPDEARAGWVESGSWGGWLDAYCVVEDEPAPQIILRAVAVAPLLRWLPLGHNPIVDLSGPRGRGKTTTLRFAGSVFGRPDEQAGGTILTWDASPTHVERTAQRSWDVALLLDDTKRARQATDVSRTLYSLSQGRGRGRGTIGGLQRTSTWRCVVVSTGEAPLVEATEAGGARARVLSLTLSPAIGSLATAKRLEQRLLVHHGHLGPRLAVRAADLGDELRVRYQRALERLAREVVADTRLLSTVAAMEVAHGVLLEIGVPEPQCDWRAHLLDALRESVTAGDQASRALDLVREDLARHPASYQSALDQREPPGGWRGIARPSLDWIGVYPGVVHQVLRDAGHDVAPIVAQWVERDVLVRNKGNLFRTRLDGELTAAMYAFRRRQLVPTEDSGGGGW